MEFVVLRGIVRYHSELRELESAVRKAGLVERDTRVPWDYYNNIYVIAKDVEIMKREMERIGQEVEEDKANDR